MKCVIINLEKRKERLEKITPLLKNSGFAEDLEIFKAVEGKAIPREDLTKIVNDYDIKIMESGVKEYTSQLSFGALGCYLSHLDLWKKIRTCKEEYVLVLEDDAIPNFNKSALEKYIRELPEDWDIFTLGGWCEVSTKINPNICKTNNFMCTHALLVKNTEKLEKLIEASNTIDKQVDYFLSEMASKGEINVYCLEWSLLKHWDQDSTYDTDIQTSMVSPYVGPYAGPYAGPYVTETQETQGEIIININPNINIKRKTIKKITINVNPMINIE